jgi:hypothetical protein
MSNLTRTFYCSQTHGRQRRSQPVSQLLSPLPSSLTVITAVSPSQPPYSSPFLISSTGRTVIELICLLRESKKHKGFGLLVSVGDSHDELERMLAVLRFAFSKELKFIRSRLGKPYNSALGRFTCRTACS